VLREKGSLAAKKWLLVSLILFTFAQALTIVQRPAGTTLFEVGLFSIGPGLFSVCLMTALSRRNWVLGCVLGILTMWAVCNTAQRYGRVVNTREFARSSRAVWEAHEYLADAGCPVIVSLPNNNHTCGSVEEAILKGLSDFPTWNVGRGAKLLLRIAPYLEFRQELKALPRGTGLMWIDPAEGPETSSRNPPVQAVTGDGSMKIRTWSVDTWPWWMRKLNVALPMEG